MMEIGDFQHTENKQLFSRIKSFKSIQNFKLLWKGSSAWKSTALKTLVSGVQIPPLPYKKFYK